MTLMASLTFSNVEPLGESGSMIVKVNLDVLPSNKFFVSMKNVWLKV